jgi:hypothetical protein
MSLFKTDTALEIIAAMIVLVLLSWIAQVVLFNVITYSMAFIPGSIGYEAWHNIDDPTWDPVYRGIRIAWYAFLVSLSMTVALTGILVGWYSARANIVVLPIALLPPWIVIWREISMNTLPLAAGPFCLGMIAGLVARRLRKKGLRTTSVSASR